MFELFFIYVSHIHQTFGEVTAKNLKQINAEKCLKPTRFPRTLKKIKSVT